MTALRHLLTGTCLAAVLFALPGGTMLAQSPRVLTGVVTSEDGKPIVEATVEWGDIQAEPDQRLQATTDMRGRYRLELAEVGFGQRLGVHAPGFAPQWRDGLRPPRDRALEIDFVLKPARFVAGRVTSSFDGNPIAGIEVVAMTAAHGFHSSFSMPVPPSPFPGPKRSAVTDEEGRFRIDDLADVSSDRRAEGQVQLNISVPNHSRHASPHKLDEVHEIRLRGGQPVIPGVIVARFVDSESGAPVTQLRVHRRHTTEAQTILAPDGVVQWTGLRAERNHLRYVFAPGYAPREVRLLAHPIDDPVEVAVEMTPHEPLQGIIVDDATGEPLPGVRLICAEVGGAAYLPWQDFDRICDGLHGFSMVQRTTSRADGSFEFAEGDKQNALFVYPQSQHARRLLLPEHREDVRVDGRLVIRLGAQSTIEGRFHVAGEPQPNCRIQIWKHQQVKPEENWETVVTDAEGKFEFTHLRAGNYTVSSSTMSRRMEVKAGETQTIVLGDDLGPHKLIGTAMPFARIRLTPSFEGSSYTSFQTQADVDGQFTIAGLNPGEYSVHIMMMYESGFIQDESASIMIEGDTEAAF